MTMRAPLTFGSLRTELSVPVLSQRVEQKVSFRVSPDRRGEAKSLIYQGPQVALLTIYDMCKAVDRAMTINGVRVLEKHGGKSGSYVAE